MNTYDLPDLTGSMRLRKIVLEDLIDLIITPALTELINKGPEFPRIEYSVDKYQKFGDIRGEG
jgi:hypothetical protein